MLYVCTYIRTYLSENCNICECFSHCSNVLFDYIHTYILPMYVHSVYMLMNLCMYTLCSFLQDLDEVDPPKRINNSTYFTVTGERRKTEVPIPESLLGSRPGEIPNKHVCTCVHVLIGTVPIYVLAVHLFTCVLYIQKYVHTYIVHP